MRRGSFRRRLPRGRSSLKASPALLVSVVFLVLLVPALLYLFPHAPNSHFAPTSSTDHDDGADLAAAKAKLSDASEPVLKVTSSEASLFAKVTGSKGLSWVHLENTGNAQLHHVEVQEAGKAMGILSRLDPGEKKVLAMNGEMNAIEVKALDPSNREIRGKVQYDQPMALAASSGPAPEDVVISTKAAPDPLDPRSKTPEASPLHLAIVANCSEGREGDVVGYRCTAVNLGPDELSDVKIFCAGKMASTNFLPKGKELHLDGSLVIHDNTKILASVQGKDAEQDKLCTNNSSISIWQISPEIGLDVSAPAQVHRGETITLQIRIENEGRGNLTDIKISDGFGEIGQISALRPGAHQILQKERVVQESISDEVRLLAHDAAGCDVYSSRLLNIRTLNSSLQIQGQPEEVRAYPGEPAEVRWNLSNTGEETLKNITLSGDGKRCMLKELSPGKSVKMAAIYSKEGTTWINVTAQGYDGRGYAALAESSVLLKTITPGISLKVMPQELEVCPGETGEISCLVTNSGDDVLTDVVVSQDGSALASIDRLNAGEFKVVNSRTVISANSTLQFTATGKDSRSQTWSDAGSVNATVVVTALKVFVSASPPSVAPGGNTKLTCTVANTGSIPLYGIFVISKKLGPIGSIDYLAPKRQMTVSAEKAILEEVNDVISAEGFTMEKKSTRGSCNLHINILKSPGLEMKGSIQNGSPPAQSAPTQMAQANLSCGNLSLPISLPSEQETAFRASQEVAREVDSSTKKTNNLLLDGISNLLRYVEKMLGRTSQESESSAARELSPENDADLQAARDYELSIAGVKSSEHGAIRILDVSAMPSQPAAGEPVKITVHIQSQAKIKSASVKYGLADAPLTRQDMLGVDRTYDSSLALESGSSQDGYWSCNLPGKAAGIYLVLSVWMTDGTNTAEGGPYMLHWSTVNSAGQDNSAKRAVYSGSGKGMLFIESSIVKGRGEVSIKDTIQGSTLHYNEKMIGNGSISMESMRCIDRKTAVDSFTEQKDLVFTGGQLKGHQTVESPTFHGGLGASVTERFNLSHVDKSETSSVSSASIANNTLTFKTDQAFDGTWNIQTKYAKFYKKIKADQQYTGSFQTQKSIKFQDADQR